MFYSSPFSLEAVLARPRAAILSDSRATTCTSSTARTSPSSAARTGPIHARHRRPSPRAQVGRTGGGRGNSGCVQIGHAPAPASAKESRQEDNSRRSRPPSSIATAVNVVAVVISLPGFWRCRDPCRAAARGIVPPQVQVSAIYPGASAPVLRPLWRSRSKPNSASTR